MKDIYTILNFVYEGEVDMMFLFKNINIDKLNEVLSDTQNKLQAEDYEADISDLEVYEKVLKENFETFEIENTNIINFNY